MKQFGGFSGGGLGVGNPSGGSATGSGVPRSVPGGERPMPRPSLPNRIPFGGGQTSQPGNSAFGHAQGNQNTGFMPPGLQQGGFQPSPMFQRPMGQGMMMPQQGMQQPQMPMGMSPQLLQMILAQMGQSRGGF